MLQDAVFDGDNIFDYPIQGGPLPVPQTDWLSSGTACVATDVFLMTRVTESGVETADLTAAYALDNLNVSIEASLLSLANVPHTVSVLAMTPDTVCRQVDFTVLPYHCSGDSFQPVTWTATGTDVIASYVHAIGVDSEVHSYSQLVNTMSTRCT